MSKDLAPTPKLLFAVGPKLLPEFLLPGLARQSSNDLLAAVPK